MSNSICILGSVKMIMYVDSSETNSRTVSIIDKHLKIVFDPPKSKLNGIGVEKLTLMNVQDATQAINTIYLNCDISRPNLYNGRSQPIIFSISKSAKSSEWKDKLYTWYADHVLMYPVWNWEIASLRLWLSDANCRILPFEYMAVALRLDYAE